MRTVNKSVADKLSNFFRTQPKGNKAWIFGSCVRVEGMPESDVDVHVRLLKDARATLFSSAPMQHKMAVLLNKKVDLVEDARLKDFVRNSAEADKILICEKST